MKYLSNKLVLIVAASLVATTTISCRKWIEAEPVSEISHDEAYSNIANATSSVLGIYDELSGDDGYGTRIPHHYANDNDETMTSGSLDNGRRGIGRYDLRAGNTELERPFRQLYRGLEKANLAIDKLPGLIQSLGTGSETEKAQASRLYGEALTLRAQFLFDLIKIWGDVPAPMVPSYKQQDLFIAKSNRDSVYDKLIADLATAKELLPWRTQVTRDERITRGAAMALRARLALFRGGYSLRGTTRTRPADYQNFYTIARTETRELMQRRDQHTLNPSFEDLWRRVNAGQYDPQGEIIFEVGMSGANSSSDSKLGRYDGPRTHVSSRYGEAGGGIEVIPTYFYLFDSVDKRRDVTITLYSVNADNTKSPRRLSEINNGKWRRDWRVPLLPGDAQFLGYNFPIIRFSDVLLMFAEADNELNNGPSAEAIAAFEEVRKRAYFGNVNQIGTTPTSKAGFFDAIVKERSLEFGSEAIRKWDLIRWNMLGDKLRETRSNLNLMSNNQGAYANVPRYMYWRRVGEEIEWFGSFYKPTPATAPPTSAGWQRLDWRQNVTSRTIDNLPYTQAPGRLFTDNKHELFPYPQSVLDSYNGRLRQNEGY